MARISQDDDSWKAGGIKRRDFRSVRNGPEVPKHGKKKNTKKWCRGQVGKLHDTEVKPWKSLSFYRDPFNRPVWVVDKCKNCGKETNFRKNPAL